MDNSNIVWLNFTQDVQSDIIEEWAVSAHLSWTQQLLIYLRVFAIDIDI